MCTFTKIIMSKCGHSDYINKTVLTSERMQGSGHWIWCKQVCVQATRLWKKFSAGIKFGRHVTKTLYWFQITSIVMYLGSFFNFYYFHCNFPFKIVYWYDNRSHRAYLLSKIKVKYVPSMIFSLKSILCTITSYIL